MSTMQDTYHIPGLEEYIQQNETSKRSRSEAWQIAIGLQQVDGLEPSTYLLQTAHQHIEGDITIDEAKRLIDTYYESREHRDEVNAERTEEADKVAARITELLEEETFTFSPAQLATIHRRLFTGIYKFAGLFRDYNITKREWVLGGDTVIYAGYDTITDTLNYDMGQEKSFSYAGLPVDEAIRHLCVFCSHLWQVHAFGEGNTRTTAVFMIKYMRTLGLQVNNDVFAAHSWYFRNALVRANYNNLAEHITETIEFLERFFRNMLLGEQHVLSNRHLHIDWKEEQTQSATSTVQSAVQSATSAQSLPSKCKNCTLDEIVVLRSIQVNPRITQKQLAVEIRKSERTVKTITTHLVEKGILRRDNGKRDGYWTILYDEDIKEED